MAVSLDAYDELVHGIYAAALQPQHWDRVIGAIAAAQQAPKAMLFTFAHPPAAGGFAFTHNIGQAALEVWAARDVAEDPWVQSAARQGLMQQGMVARDVQLLPEQELLQTRFYRQILAPLDIAKVCTGLVFDGTDAHKLPVALSAFRPQADPAFSSEDAELMRRLMAHLARALGVMFHLRDNQLQLAGSLAALDRMGSGIVLLDASRQVQFANHAAQRHFAAGQGVRVRSGVGTLGLQPALASFEPRLQRAIDLSLGAIASDLDNNFFDGIVLPTPQDAPACVVHVAPLAPAPHFSAAGAPARAIVFIYDLQLAASVDPDQLCALFDLTPAEARAALQLTHGGTVEQMAARSGVGANTFKTQLQAAYRKTGTHRQADLLKLLLALASH